MRSSSPFDQFLLSESHEWTRYSLVPSSWKPQRLFQTRACWNSRPDPRHSEISLTKRWLIIQQPACCMCLCAVIVSTVSQKQNRELSQVGEIAQPRSLAPPAALLLPLPALPLQPTTSDGGVHMSFTAGEVFSLSTSNCYSLLLLFPFAHLQLPSPSGGGLFQHNSYQNMMSPRFLVLVDFRGIISN